MLITRSQRRALKRLLDCHNQWPGYRGFRAFMLGSNTASVLLKLQNTDLVKIDKSNASMFYYSITDAGKEAIK